MGSGKSFTDDGTCDIEECPLLRAKPASVNAKPERSTKFKGQPTPSAEVRKCAGPGRALGHTPELACRQATKRHCTFLADVRLREPDPCGTPSGKVDAMGTPQPRVDACAKAAGAPCAAEPALPWQRPRSRPGRYSLLSLSLSLVLLLSAHHDCGLPSFRCIRAASGHCNPNDDRRHKRGKHDWTLDGLCNANALHTLGPSSL